MGEQPEVEEVVDDLNVDEVEETFDDPVLEEDEPEEELETVPSASVDEAEGTLPIPSALPQPTYQAPLPTSDNGFTPQTPVREEYQPPPQPQIQFFTVAQLSEGVNNGVITEDQKFEQLQLQNRELAKRDAAEAWHREQRTQTLRQELNEYSQLVPGWDVVGTPANLEATRNYQDLLKRGLSENETTKLLALERTFGPAHRIKAARASKVRTSTQRDTAQEVGRRGTSPSSKSKADPLSILSLDEKRLYKSYIDKGIYKNWGEVRAEVKGAATQTSNPQLRAKHAGLMK